MNTRSEIENPGYYHLLLSIYNLYLSPTYKYLPGRAVFSSVPSLPTSLIPSASTPPPKGAPMAPTMVSEERTMSPDGQLLISWMMCSVDGMVQVLAELFIVWLCECSVSVFQYKRKVQMKMNRIFLLYRYLYVENGIIYIKLNEC